MIKRLLLSLFVCVGSALSLQAQNNVNIYTSRLGMPDAVTSAQVKVSNDADVSAGINIGSKGEVAGYRICIFFDNTQNARNLANSALRRFKGQFQGIPSEVVYDNPIFKTMIGYCIDNTEAAMLRGMVLDMFPKAFFVRDESIPISKLKHYNSSVAATDSLSMTDVGGDFKF